MQCPSQTKSILWRWSHPFSKQNCGFSSQIEEGKLQMMIEKQQAGVSSILIIYIIYIYTYEHLLTSPLKKPTKKPCSDWSCLLLREAIKAPYEARSIEMHCSGGAALFDGTKTVAGCPQNWTLKSEN